MLFFYIMLYKSLLNLNYWEIVPSVHLACYTRLLTRNQKSFSHRSESCEVQEHGTDRFNIWWRLSQGQQCSWNLMGRKGQGWSLAFFDKDTNHIHEDPILTTISNKIPTFRYHLFSSGFKVYILRGHKHLV